ncbi:MAG TPA: TIGR04283 family arsenosugar biosynthesis glycosyltransferase [Gemmatimonadota bacterium]|nr:TIGR04283 family arsenosugar biosynthesis glycosyltransferase [Gemmatimonadota bacterium]
MTVSVVVPALDEADLLPRTLRAARVAFGPSAELVVVDGGSEDGTPAAAEGLARVIRSAPGRGRQMNAGARASRGEVLVFVHADTIVEARAGADLRRALRDPETAGGCLRFALPPRPAGGGLRRAADALLETAVRARTRLFRTATGDQVIFARRSAFEAVGGFPDYPLFEDVELVRKIRREGGFRVLSARATTSGRRWEERGWLRTVLLHLALRGAFHLGVPARRLAAWYGPPVSARRDASADRGRSARRTSGHPS